MVSDDEQRTDQWARDAVTGGALEAAFMGSARYVDRLSEIKRTIVEELKAQNWSAALVLLDEWCTADGGDPRVWLNRGYCLLQLGRAADAHSALDRCLELDPSNHKAAHLRDRAARIGLSDLETAGVAGASGAAAATAPVSAASRETSSGPELSPAKGSPTPEASFATLPTADPERTWRMGSLVGGRYEVRDMAKGGMGVVYFAFDRELQRMVAVKTPLPSLLSDPEGQARFFREAEAWINLGMHPNVCTAYYVQNIGGLPRLFIEFVDGGDLGRWLKGRSDRRVEEGLDLAIQVATGMSHTHTVEWTDEAGVPRRGLVHRDLKPANVLIGTDGVARITDFGLVKALVETADSVDGRADVRVVREAVIAAGSSGTWRTVTGVGGLLGTPPYMAPELWRGSASNHVPADIYAFGCMMYEIFCGRRPFVVAGSSMSGNRGEVFGEWARLHIHQEPPDPTLLGDGIAGSLALLMAACVAKDPESRPSSFAEIRSRLVEIYREETGEGYPRPEPRRSKLLADSLNNRGVSFLALGQHKRAETAWRQALTIDPHHLEATSNLSLLEWRTSGLTDIEILRRLSEAVRNQDSGWRGSMLLGNAHLFLDNLAQATEHLGAAAEHVQAPAGVHRAFALACLAEARATGTEAPYRRALDLLSLLPEELCSDYRVGLAKAVALEGIGMQADALELWKSTRERNADLPEDLDEARELLPGREPGRVIQVSSQVESLAAVGGDRVVVRYAGAHVKVLDVADGDELCELRLPGVGRRGRSLACVGSGPFVVAIAEGLPLTLWNLDERRRAGQLRVHPGIPTSVAASSDGRWIVSGGSDRAVRVWDARSGECMGTLAGHQAYVAAVLFHPMCDRVVSGGGDGVVRVWRVADGACAHTLSGHRGVVAALAMDDGGRWLVTGGEDRALRVWDPESGELLRTLVGHGDRVASIAVLSAEGVAVSGSLDQTVRWWSLERGEALRVMRFSHPIHDVVAAGPGDVVAVGCGATVELLRVSAGSSARLPVALTPPVSSEELGDREQRFRAALDSARELMRGGQFGSALIPLSEARQVAGYALHDEALELWSEMLTHFPRAGLRSASELRSFRDHDGQVVAVRFAPHHEVLCTGDQGGGLRLFDPSTGELLRRIDAHAKAVTDIDLSGDGSRVISAGRDGSVCLWNAGNAECVLRCATHEVVFEAVALSPDDRFALLVRDDGSVRVWSFDSPDQLELLGRHDEALACVSLSPDGRLGVTGGWDQSLSVWDLIRRIRVRHQVIHDSVVRTLAVSPEGRRLASGGDDGAVCLWDMATGQRRRALIGHEGAVTSVAFVADGRFLLSGGRDSTIRLWDVRTGACVFAIRGHTDAVHRVDLSRDGRFAASAGADSTLRLWFLDWQPEVGESSGWDDRARPFLEVFLRLHQQPGNQRPIWTDGDLDLLVADLGLRGFGRLRRDRVAQELGSLSAQMGGREEQRDRQRGALGAVEPRRPRPQQIRTAARRTKRSLGPRLILAVVGGLLLLLGVASLRTPETRTVPFNTNLKVEYAAQVQARIRALAEPGHVLAYHGKYEAGLDTRACVPAHAPQYLELLLRPFAHGGEGLDASKRCTDDSFRTAYHEAVACLPRVEGADIVDPVLRATTLEMEAERLQDVLSVLVQLGEDAVPALIGALESGTVEVRHTAALALVYMDNEAALESLVRALSGDSAAANEAASFVLREIIILNGVSEAESFALVERLTHSIDPRVRRNAVRALSLFQRDKAVRRLVAESSKDLNRDVRETAVEVDRELREARINEILGLD